MKNWREKKVKEFKTKFSYTAINGVGQWTMVLRESEATGTNMNLRFMGHLENKTPSIRFPVGFVVYCMPECNLYKIVEKKFNRVVANFGKTTVDKSKFEVVKFMAEFFKVITMDYIHWRWDDENTSNTITVDAYGRVLRKKINIYRTFSIENYYINILLMRLLQITFTRKELAN